MKIKTQVPKRVSWKQFVKSNDIPLDADYVGIEYAEKAFMVHYGYIDYLEAENERLKNITMHVAISHNEIVKKLEAENERLKARIEELEQ